MSFFKPGLILLIPVFLGCDSANDIGTQFDLNTNVDVSLMEFDFPSTNVLIDSLRTDGEDRLVVGTYNDPLTGRVTAETYFQFRFQRGFLPGDTLTFDSAQITLATSAILPLLGESNLEIDVFQIEDTLINGVVYLATKQETKSRQVGNLTTTVRSTDETIAIKLDDFYGQELFDKLKNKPDTVGTANLFFKGLALVSGASNESLVSFDARADTSKLRIYMTGDTTQFAEFTIQTSLHTHITRDKSMSPLNGIVEKQDFDIPGDGRTVLDPLAGITTSFNIDGLKSFFDDNPNLVINTSILDFFADGFGSRDSLQGFHIYFRKPDGGIFGPAIVHNPFPNIVMTDQGYLSGTSNPAAILYNTNTNKYSVSPTLFFQSLYTNFQKWKNEHDGEAPDELYYIEPFQGDTVRISDMILIHPTQMTLQQVVFRESGVKLRLFYTDVN